MASRKLQAQVMSETFSKDGRKWSVVTLRFNRQLSPLEVQGINALVNGLGVK